MKRQCACVTAILFLCLMFVPLAAHSLTLSYIDKGISAVRAGGWAGLYHMELDGSSVAGMCDDYYTHIAPPYSWEVDLWTYNDIASGEGKFAPAELYGMAGYLFSQTFNQTDPDVLANLNLAIWKIMSSGLDISYHQGASTYYYDAQGHGNFMWGDVMCVLTPTPNASYAQEFLVRLNPVPEPATMLLLGAGLIGLVGVGRTKWFKRG